jgi:iron(III) transport system substrate-binding protein
MRKWLTFGALALATLALAIGCDRGGGEKADVVLYTAIDEPVARQIIEAFEQETGYSVRLVTDTEATKSVGLAERLRAEKNRPQADVWWGNEPFHTIALAEEGLLAAYDSPAAAEIDPLFRDPENRWAGNGLRARVLAISESVAEGLVSDPSIEDLLREEFRGKIALARPTAGTTGSHVAALYVLWGEDVADAYFNALRENGVTLVGSNSHVAQQVGQGNYLLGLTDNDDVANARSGGGKLRPVLPDQHEGGIGTLTLPTTVGLVASRPDNPAARQLVDFLLSAETEQRLAEASFTAYSVRGGGEASVKSMRADYAEVARRLPEAVARATALLEGREPPE